MAEFTDFPGRAAVTAVAAAAGAAAVVVGLIEAGIRGRMCT
jgi:hypothetical protein